MYKPRRANALTKQDLRNNAVMQKYKTSARFKTLNGKERYLTARKCSCDRWHWSQKDSKCIGKQKLVAKLCPTCFTKHFNKSKPPYFRFLTKTEIQNIYREYEAMGVKVYQSITN